MKQIHLLAAISFTLLVALGSCKNKAAQPAANSQPQQYKVLQVQPQSTSVYTDYPATLQGQEVVEIRPKIEGYLEQQFVDEGARVKKGQLLFRISSPEYEQALRSAAAGISTAQADVDAAQMAVNKTKPLTDKGIISKYELQTAQFTLQSKQAALTQAGATLANARANVGYLSITSPSDGIIGTIPFKRGSLVSGTSAEPLTTLSSDKAVYAYFALNEKQVLEFNRNFKGVSTQEKLKNLPPVQLVLADGSVYSHEGRIQTESGLITTETGSASIRAAFPNPEALLKSGGSASVRIRRQIDTALVIPQSATSELQDKRLVRLVGNDNRVQSKAITTTPTNDGNYFIVTAGLAAGDKVVLNGGTALKDSTAIQPIMANAQTVYSSLK
ncbi:MAG: efflux RND transporter periplasmic adaptor subunit [Williamsia sp.]|nr:efflux RND transporter periplasmic adaptor subunit [Williamsia sp.]